MMVHLLLIDPQNDFCDGQGSLFVPGADGDMSRLARMIRRLVDQLDAISVTLDGHSRMDISHPVWYVDSEGSQPPPFTMMGMDGARLVGRFPPEYAEGREYQARTREHTLRTKEYLRALEEGGRYPHLVWPEHCLIGSWGHGVYPALFEALLDWEEGFRRVSYESKGSNIWTEHFSAVRAEVPDPEDPGTQVNRGLIEAVSTADMVLLAGEARSHCLANTVRDLVAEAGTPDLPSRLHLLTDACSDVPGFESYGEGFVAELTAAGMKLTTTEEVAIG